MIVINGILYCYDEDECVMGWKECNINKCPRYLSEIVPKDVINESKEVDKEGYSKIADMISDELCEQLSEKIE
jgi:hypothetical protein